MRNHWHIPKALTLTLILSGCTSARFPLCPKLAAVSYSDAKPEAVVNSYLMDQANERHVKISPMSSFAAVLSGSAKSLSWFQRNYAFMLCSFDPKQVINDESVYLACMSNAQEWVSILQSNRPEDLMIKETHYADTCAK